MVDRTFQECAEHADTAPNLSFKTIAEIVKRDDLTAQERLLLLPHLILLLCPGPMSKVNKKVLKAGTPRFLGALVLLS